MSAILQGTKGVQLMVKNGDIHTVIDLDPVSVTVLNALNAQIAVVSPEGTIVAHNKRWKLVIDELQESWSHPRLEENILDSLQAPLASGSDSALRLLLGIKEVLSSERSEFETQFGIRLDDNQKWYRASFSTLGADEGGLLVYEDITHQQKSRQYLRETREKLQKYFHNNLCGILVADENNTVIEANTEACNILGISPKKLTYSNIGDFLKPAVELKIPEIQKRINEEGNYLGEYTLTVPGGKNIPIELSVTLFRDENGKNIASWAFKDISTQKNTEQALKKSEMQYKLQFNNTLEGTLIGRPDGQILAANPAACELLGYSEEELQNLHRDDIFDPNRPANAEALEKRKARKAYSGEVEFTHKDGHIIPVEVSSTLFEGEDGTPKTIINIRDISKRKAVQQQLLLEKEFTESAISSLPTAFFVFKKSGELVRWNDVLEKDFGYTPEELARMNVLDLIHPEDKVHVKKHLDRELTGEQVNFEIRGISKEGNLLHYLISGTSFHQNNEPYIVGSGLNQNSVKKIEQEKNKNAELLSQLFGNSPIGIVLIDNNGQVQKVNQSFEKLFGYTNCELSGELLDDIIVPAHMDRQAQSLSNLSFTGDSFQTEVPRKRKDGSEIPVLVGGVPVEVNGEIIAIYGMYVDISERKQLEHKIVELLETEQKARLRMEDMFEEAPSGIALLEGPNHIYTFANEKYKELVGRQQLKGHPISKVVPEFSDQGFMDLLDICFNEGKPFHFNERKVYFYNPGSKKQEKHYLNLAVKPLKDDHQNIYGVFVEAIDVTEQVEARKIIEDSLAEKEILLNEVHHRVKNNLAIISGLLELEMMETDNEQVYKHLHSSQSRITTIANVHELLYQNASLSHVDFKKFIESVVGSEGHFSGRNGDSLISQFNLDEVVLNVNQAIPAGMLLNELLTIVAENLPEGLQNPGQSLKMYMKNYDSSIEITISDISKKILEPLFSSSQKSLRIELVNVLLTQIQGTLNFDDTPTHTLNIQFSKREAKGPHSSLSAPL